MPFDTNFIKDRLQRSAQVIRAMSASAGEIERLALAVRTCLAGGGKVLSCGNGGSAAEALHLAEELVGKYKRNRRPFPALCLNADPTALTCIANDYGFEEVFARQVEALAARDDALIVLSTSGKSPNILAALRCAKAKGVATLGLLGKGGGEAATLCDAAIVVPSDDTEHIQEAHQVMIHLILEAVEGS